jgi:hypothetical protein
MTNQRNGTKSLGGVLGHLFLPELIRNTERLFYARLSNLSDKRQSTGRFTFPLSTLKSIWLT